MILGKYVSRCLKLTGLSTLAFMVSAMVSVMVSAQSSLPQDSFSITIDGQQVAGDRRLSTTQADADIALARARLQVQFDGLEVKPRLTALITNARAPVPGDRVDVRSQMNYPAYVTRGEIRVTDTGARGGSRVVARTPIAANGEASFVMPEGNSLIMTYRVYDAQGRFDETVPLPLRPADGDYGPPGVDAPPPELGEDRVGRRRIPVSGGAVTVSGTDVRQGAVVNTLGETVRPDPDGSFVIQRILPAGDQVVAAHVTGAGEDTYIERKITIPLPQWFYTGIADLTFGVHLKGSRDPAGAAFDRTFSYGRLSGYAKGKTRNGWTLTGSVDTGEDDLSDLLRDLDEKDPVDVLQRLQRENAYPVYGDDSTFEEGAPTDGKVFLRAERNGSHIMWGNYQSTVDGGYYLRDERTLYGLQGVYRSPQTTSRGQPLVDVEGYAASPERLPGRDTFLGNGGSVYFLQRQDITVDSENLSVQLRDRNTGRVVETRQLTPGRDYSINYIQGTIILSAPLSGRSATGAVVSDPSGDFDVILVANYAYTPAAGEIDGYTYGGRAEAWVNDNIRLGFSGMVEQTDIADETDIADQTAQSVDLLWELGDRSFVALEYARTEGPGFGSSLSIDGGLIVENRETAGLQDGAGDAFAARMQLDLGDLGHATRGTIAAYSETRGAGFSTLDYETTVDEDLWGLSFDDQPSDWLSYRFYYDNFADADGKTDREAGVELSYAASDRLTLDFGLEHVDLNTPGAITTSAANRNGSRNDVAVRGTISDSEAFAWYLFGQQTLSRSGMIEQNNRAGAGLHYRFAENWAFEGEVSDGSLGVGAAALLNYTSADENSAYLGYALEPGREFSGATLVGKDRGQFVAGRRQRIGKDVDVFVENTHDLFGEHRALTSTYGVEYRTTEQLTLTGNFEYGAVDASDGALDRKALSFGARHENETGLSLSGRVELRRDRGETQETDRDSDALFFVGSGRYIINDDQRLVFSLDYADTDTDGASLSSGEYYDAQAGYAYRPALDDRLNMLFRYRYLKDTVGQQIDGSSERGPRQVSHVMSLDAAYDLNPRWTVGARIGRRWGRSSPDETIALADNDAYLGVVNARYHLTHKWDLLLEARHLRASDAGLSEYGLLGAGYRQIGKNVKLGVGYNSGRFSDDLTDLTFDDEGLFINLAVKF